MLASVCGVSSRRVSRYAVTDVSIDLSLVGVCDTVIARKRSSDQRRVSVLHLLFLPLYSG
jgi:hypothetical protein